MMVWYGICSEPKNQIMQRRIYNDKRLNTEICMHDAINMMHKYYINTLYILHITGYILS